MYTLPAHRQGYRILPLRRLPNLFPLITLCFIYLSLHLHPEPACIRYSLFVGLISCWILQVIVCLYYDVWMRLANGNEIMIMNGQYYLASLLYRCLVRGCHYPELKYDNSSPIDLMGLERLERFETTPKLTSTLRRRPSQRSDTS